MTRLNIPLARVSHSGNKEWISTSPQVRSKFNSVQRLWPEVQINLQTHPRWGAQLCFHSQSASHHTRLRGTWVVRQPSSEQTWKMRWDSLWRLVKSNREPGVSPSAVWTGYGDGDPLKRHYNLFTQSIERDTRSLAHSLTHTNAHTHTHTHTHTHPATKAHF